ncbi:MAG: pseudouridine synthase [Candidatus Dactylopiibacterium sp.]|nr:pseudouridine synthase [Candidatus Dactylopiibacterium sp.]
MPPATPSYRPPPEGPLPLLHVDAHLLVLDKPSGLLSVPGRGADKADCLASRVQRHYPDALVVHRLDMETSGLILMARSPEMQRALGLLFETRRIHKRYVACVGGCPEPAAGIVDLPLITDWPNRPRQIVDHALGKPARTHYRVVAGGPQAGSRVALEPVTGRSHQLRVHMQALGHPILGDALYAPAELQAAAPRLLLHAEWLGFTHPATDEPCEFFSPAPF